MCYIKKVKIYIIISFMDKVLILYERYILSKTKNPHAVKHEDS